MNTLKHCRDCGHEVSTSAPFCPHCGAIKPYLAQWDGYGFEYRSAWKILGWPLLHISFKYRDRHPVPARGVVAIGQFGIGLITIAQFGMGAVALTQFGVGLAIVTQFGAGVIGIAQIGIFLYHAYGQFIYLISP